ERDAVELLERERLVQAREARAAVRRLEESPVVPDVERARIAGGNQPDVLVRMERAARLVDVSHLAPGERAVGRLEDVDGAEVEGVGRVRLRPDEVIVEALV